MKPLLLLLLFCTTITASIDAQQPYWQQEVNYTIAVTLNDTEHTLDGYVKMDYHNNSPDTLRFIWIHLWPNAYKNDRTAFSDQSLDNGSTRFYFSNAQQRGYINRLEYKVDGSTATIADHPQHQDIIQLLLPTPLVPGSSVRIETPFHVKIPDNFSRSGHKEQAYLITQWYPKPAVYDRKGWHPMPYLDQGEFYSEFGSYTVQITLPKNYIVATTGQLISNTPGAGVPALPPPTAKTKKPTPFLAPEKKSGDFPPSDAQTTTLVYQADRVHDFAWFADKRYRTKKDTMQLPSGKIVALTVCYLPAHEATWVNAIPCIKKTILTRSQWLGEYPYPVCTVVEAEMGFGGGMEYPAITSIAPMSSAAQLEQTIEHEVGHNWNYGILASNERDHPWLDEGVNSFYDNRYFNKTRQPNGVATVPGAKTSWLRNKMPEDLNGLLLETMIGLKKDQPIDSHSEAFTALSYNLIAYTKAAQWLRVVQDSLGQSLFDSCMHEFYRKWQFKHPYPEDLLQTIATVSGKKTDALFALLQQKGSLLKPQRKKIRLTTFFNLKETDRYQYISIAPAIGYNFYDKAQIGALIHNYTLPLPKFRFAIAPLIGTGNKTFGGIGHLAYTWFSKKPGQTIVASIGGARFNKDTFLDTAGITHYLDVIKWAPSLRINFGSNNPKSTITRFLEWKTFLIAETGLRFTRDTVNKVDIITYPRQSRYINQLSFGIRNSRVLYPWDALLQAEQGDGFLRTTITGNYFFNYAKGGGLNVRVFAGKFFYTADKTISRRFGTDRYHLNMTGPKGDEDYTYSNYFAGRNEFERAASQQIMIRDGAFKVRTDLLSNKIGKTDDWLTAVNFTSTIPASINPLEILPFKLPLRVFADIGTYAGAWQKEASTGRVLYDAGLQLSLFNNTVNIYMPLLYSKVYKDYFRSTITEKRFVRNLSFSIDFQQFRPGKLPPQLFF